MNKKFDINVDPTTDEYVVTLRFKCNKNRVALDGESLPETYSEITGVVDTDSGEFGFAYTIDMDYKGKPDQYTKNFISMSYFMDEQDFIIMCEDWSIPLVIE